MNALLHPYNTPRGTVPFNSLTLSDYEEAIMEGIKLHDGEIDLITEDPSAPTFSNTIEALEKSGSLLDRSSSVFFNLLSAERSDALESLAEKLSPILSEHSSKLLHNTALFRRIKTVYEQYQSDSSLSSVLDIEDKKLLEDTYIEFVRHGANLNDSDKENLASLSQSLSLLSITFSQNHLKDLNAFSLHITDAHEVTGVPDTAMSIAKEEATRLNLDGWLFTLQAPSYVPFMTYCSNRSLRKEMYMAYNTLCLHGDENDNREIALKIINIRREIAQLLGYSSYADYVLERRMSENTKNVYRMFDELISSYMPVAKSDVRRIESLAKELEGSDFTLEPWDFSYYSNKLKERDYAINSEMVRPYLQLDLVKEGVFGLATELYGLHFVRNKSIPVYHPDVEAYEVFDEDGDYQAVLYCDFFPRPSKQSGAWMTSYKEQWIDDDGFNSRPHVSVTTNFTKPTSDKPSLLTLGELETFLHEFGHSLHGMLSNVRHKSLNGTNVYWDFVELPSQFMENYAFERDFLRKFAFHYESGEPLPDEMLDKIISSRNFNAAYSCIRQVSLGMLDMSYYTMSEPFASDIIEHEKKIFDKTRLLPYAEGTCMSTQFDHIMSSGYSAGYYSYKWAEILDADAFSVFKREGIFNRQTSSRFRDCILSRGGSEHPMTLYKRFRGGEPTIDALLERNGIVRH